MRLANPASVASVVLAVVLVASATSWLLTFSARRDAREPVRNLPAGEVAIAAPPADTAGIARLLGAASGSAGIRALGVMAEGSSGRGIALIGVDGQPARVVRAGEAIAPGVILAEVRRDGVVVSRSGALEQIHVATKPLPPGLLRAP